MKLNDEILKQDTFNFVLKAYGEIIYRELQTTELGASFFANNESYIDSYTSLKNTLQYPSGIKVTFFNDYSIGEKFLISDIGVAEIKSGDNTYKFIKVVIPFTFAKSYDFIIFRKDDAEEILHALHVKRQHKDFEMKNFPIVGLDLSEIKKHTIDFLLNEDFRKFCEAHYIKLKRGIILEGKPGNGKTMTIQWLKNVALNNDIEFHVFSSGKEFLDEQDEYFDNAKKIFVFEDFDSLLQDRKENGYTPNGILSTVLNTLEGVNEINNVVSVFTTNAINIFDDAFIRPGRIDKVFTYYPPKAEIYKDFFKAYIPEEKIMFDFIEDYLVKSNADISFAILKGVCDDVNIFKFNNQRLLSEEDYINIIEEKIKSSNKNNQVKKAKDYIL